MDSDKIIAALKEVCTSGYKLASQNSYINFNSKIGFYSADGSGYQNLIPLSEEEAGKVIAISQKDYGENRSLQSQWEAVRGALNGRSNKPVPKNFRIKLARLVAGL